MAARTARAVRALSPMHVRARRGWRRATVGVLPGTVHARQQRRSAAMPLLEQLRNRACLLVLLQVVSAALLLRVPQGTQIQRRSPGARVQCASRQAGRPFWVEDLLLPDEWCEVLPERLTCRAGSCGIGWRDACTQLQQRLARPFRCALQFCSRHMQLRICHTTDWRVTL